MNNPQQNATRKKIPQNIISVVDVGTTKIVALIGKKDEKGKIRILGIGKEATPYSTVKRGVILNIVKTSEMIGKAVKEAEEQSGVKVHSVFVGIAGQHINCRRESNTKMFKSDQMIDDQIIEELRAELHNLQLEPGHQIIHIVPQHYKINTTGGIISPKGMFAKKIIGYYNVIEGEIESVQNIARSFNSLQLEIANLFLEPLASAEAVLTEEEREVGVAIVDIGGGTTDLAVFHGGALKHTAVISLGGNIITSDIQKETKILYKSAEIIKKKYGSAIAIKQEKPTTITLPGINGRKPHKISQYLIEGIIQARMEEILEFVKYELYNSNVADKLGAGIVITGGGAMLKNLKVLAEYILENDIRIATPRQVVSAGQNNLNNPKYSTAVGLMVLGFQNAQTEKTLEEFEKELETEEQAPEIKEKQREEFLETKEKNIKRGNSGFLGKVKNVLQDLFVEKDSDL